MEAQIARGFDVYHEQYCGVCHQLDAAGTGGIFGPPHNNVGAIAAERIRAPDYGGDATTAAGYIRESIVEPGVYIVEGYGASRHPMPAYTHISDAELDALVQMLLSQQ